MNSSLYVSEIWTLTYNSATAKDVLTDWEYANTLLNYNYASEKFY